MKKLLIGVVGALAVLIAALLVVPSFIDWNAYRSEIATEVRKATGRRLAIDGSIGLALLPAPQLSVSNARLANLDGASAPEMVKLAALDLRIALLPLLGGEVVVRSVVLKGADIELERLADGRVNWDFAGKTKGATGAPSEGAARDGMGGAIRLEQVSIEDGRVTYRDSATGTLQRVDKIDARLAAGTLQGPFVLRGRFAYSGVPLTFEGRAGRLDAGRPTGFALTVGLPGAEAEAKLSGTVTAADAPGLEAKLDLAGPNLADFVAEAGRAGGGDGTAPEMLARRFTVTADITAAKDQVTINNLALDVDGSRAIGAVTVALGAVTEIDATLGANRLDLDGWLEGAGAKRKTKPKAKAAPGANQGAAARPAGFALPTSIRAQLDASVAALTARGGVVRDLRVRAGLEAGVLRLSGARAELPGGTELAVKGQLRGRKGKPRFDGDASLASSDFRTFLDWAGADTSAIAADRLSRVKARAVIGAEPGRLDVTGIDVGFDSSRVTGGMVVALRERIGIGARFSLDRINLDAYLAASPADAAAKGKAAKGGGAPANAGAGGGLTAFDANLDLRVGDLRAKGQRVRGVAFDGSLVGGELTIRSLSVADLASAKLSLSGKVAGLGGIPAPDLKLDLSTADPAPLMALIGMTPPSEPKRLAPLRLTGSLTAKGAAARLDLALGLAKATLTAKGEVKDIVTAPRLALDVAARHPDFAGFVRMFDPAYVTEKPAKGPFMLAARLEGAGLDLTVHGLDARLGEARLRGKGSLSLAGVRPRLKADLKAGVLVADALLPASEKAGAQRAARGKARAAAHGDGTPWTDEPLELATLKVADADLKIEAERLDWRHWQVASPRLDLTIDDGTLTVRRLAGSMVGGTFHMTGMLAAAGKPGGVVRGALDIDVSRVDLKAAMFNAAAIDVADGIVDFRLSAKGAGASSRALVASLAGSGALDARDGAVRGFDLASVNARLKDLSQPAGFLGLAQAAMSGGTTKFSVLKATFEIKKGVVKSNDISLAADGGKGSGTLALDLPRWRINSRAKFTLAGVAGAPPFGFRLDGPIDQPRRVIEADQIQAWLATRAASSLIETLVKPKRQTAAPPASGEAAPAKPQPSLPPPEEFLRGIFDTLKKR